MPLSSTAYVACLVNPPWLDCCRRGGVSETDWASRHLLKIRSSSGPIITTRRPETGHARTPARCSTLQWKHGQVSTPLSPRAAVACPVAHRWLNSWRRNEASVTGAACGRSPQRKSLNGPIITTRKPETGRTSDQAKCSTRQARIGRTSTMLFTKATAVSLVVHRWRNSWRRIEASPTGASHGRSPQRKSSSGPIITTRKPETGHIRIPAIFSTLQGKHGGISMPLSSAATADCRADYR